MKQSTQYILIRRGQGLMRHSPARALSAAARYTVLERLGAGATATVHRAIEHLAGGGERLVALKRLLPHLADDAHFVDAFVQRASQAAPLVHPGIVRVYRLGRGGTGWFLSRELVRGQDLGALLRRCQEGASRPPLGVALALIDQLLAALAHIHGAADDGGRPLGLVHGDLSPANLLVDRTGRLAVTDVGLAGVTASDPAISAGLLRGKWAYMSPEALGGEPLHPGADVYAAGILAWELVTGRSLFGGSSDADSLQRARLAEALPPSAFSARVPFAIDQVILRALERDPARRWPSAAAMQAALDAARARRVPAVGPAQVAAWLSALPGGERPVRLAAGSVDAELPEPDDDNTPIYRRARGARR